MEETKLSILKKAVKHFGFTKEELNNEPVILSGFSEACYNDNTISELMEASDEVSKKDWNLTEGQYLAEARKAALSMLQDLRK